MQQPEESETSGETVFSALENNDTVTFPHPHPHREERKRGEEMRRRDGRQIKRATSFCSRSSWLVCVGCVWRLEERDRLTAATGPGLLLQAGGRGGRGGASHR
ncbi:hypothetical protein EYF80_068428 [Liparis tanakae]|uniref:Uncharacterized protein n=1 Tax=Liparis tanakae TaxID=230148 RepID=A0A4Z2DY22_9TELE|nr:hypothetical protein EYF80_068428 [Liparis tanakae]